MLVLAAALALGGCSLALSGPGADRPRDRAPRCDTGKGLVVADSIVGSALGVAGLVALGEDLGSVALLPVGAGAAFVLAAINGNSSVNDCRAAMDAYDARQAPLSPVGRAARAQVVTPPPVTLPVTAPVVRTPPVVVPPPAPAPPAPSPAPAPGPPLAKPAPSPSSPAPDPWAEFWKELP
jgi:hypothetical protein